MANITHIDHIAIAVNSIDEVRAFYEQALGLSIDHVEEMPKRGIKTAFITIGPCKIELMEPLHEGSEISAFLAKKGPGIHHIAFSTPDVDQTTSKLKAAQVTLIYAHAQEGAHNSRVNFIHPKSSAGVLMEVVQPHKP